MATGAAVGVPLLATVSAPPAGDAVLIATSVVGASAAGAVVLWRRKLLGLPLELAEVACRSVYAGHPVFRFRVRLGRNRMLTAGRASVRFVTATGELDLPIELPCVHACVGPWTLVVLDRMRQCVGEGRFVVDVEAKEGTKDWQVTQTYALDDMQQGRFSSAVTVTADAMTLHADGWDKVVVEDSD